MVYSFAFTADARSDRRHVERCTGPTTITLLGDQNTTPTNSPRPTKNFASNSKTRIEYLYSIRVMESIDINYLHLQGERYHCKILSPNTKVIADPTTKKDRMARFGETFLLECNECNTSDSANHKRQKRPTNIFVNPRSIQAETQT